jgi:hypothetical protein
MVRRGLTLEDIYCQIHALLNFTGLGHKVECAVVVHANTYESIGHKTAIPAQRERVRIG